MPKNAVSTALKFVFLVAIVVCPAVPLLVVSIPSAIIAICFTVWYERVIQNQIIRTDDEMVKLFAYSLSGGVATLAIWMIWSAVSHRLATWFVFVITWPLGLGIVSVKFLLADSNPYKAFYQMLGILGYKETDFMQAGMKGVMGMIMEGFDLQRSSSFSSVGDAMVSPEVKIGLAGAAIFSLMGLAFAMGCGAVTYWYEQDHFEIVCERFANGTAPTDPAQCVLRNSKYDIFKALPAIGGTAVSMYGILQLLTKKIMEEGIQPLLKTMTAGHMGGGLEGLGGPLMNDPDCNQQ